jgi:riboflavin synthase
MFTGIITGIGHITQVTPLGSDEQHGVRVRLLTPPGYLADARHGDSIAINGACMTLTTFDPQEGWLTVDVSAESLARTTGFDQTGPVNLEKALRPQDRLGGHMVSGHIDGLGHVTRFEPVGESWELRLQVPHPLARFMAVKGSITIHGVSLTLNAVNDQPGPEAPCEVRINLVPHTVQNTTLSQLKPHSAVNVEVDLMARYCERILSHSKGIKANG